MPSPRKAEVARAEQLQAVLFEVIENQLRLNDPPEARLTLKRLMGEGYSREQAFHLIARPLAAETFGAMRKATEYSAERYESRLRLLPETPWWDPSLDSEMALAGFDPGPRPTDV